MNTKNFLKHLPVPELMPIRLTRQLTQLMSPIGTAGLFRATMIYAMNALRENADILLSTMDVFIKEPLMEWMVNVIVHCLIFFCSQSIHRNMHLNQVNKYLKSVCSNTYQKKKDNENNKISLFAEASLAHKNDAYAKDRIRSARLKLNGINPAVITGYR